MPPPPTAVTRGEPSEAQMRAALAAWPDDLPLPSDGELRAIVRAANRAPWPDQPVYFCDECMSTVERMHYVTCPAMVRKWVAPRDSGNPDV